jgi:hypothetical protein
VPAMYNSELFDYYWIIVTQLGISNIGKKVFFYMK